MHTNLRLTSVPFVRRESSHLYSKVVESIADVLHHLSTHTLNMVVAKESSFKEEMTRFQIF